MLGLALILALLPGLVLVRAPWLTVPGLSIALWILSWSVAPGFGSGRQVFVQTALAIFGVMAFVRVLQPRLWSAPRSSHVCLAGACVLLLIPYLMIEVPAIPDLSADAAAARLLVWRDGIPRSAAPLRLGEPFGPEAPGFEMLSADLAGLSGGAVHRSTFLLYRFGLAVFGLAMAFATQRILRFGSWAVALSGITAALLLDLAGHQLPAIGSMPMASALALYALSLIVRPSTRSAAVAAGTLAASAGATCPVLAPALVATLGGCWVWERRRTGSVWNHASLAAVVALALGASFAFHLEVLVWPDPLVVAASLVGVLTAVTGGALAGWLAQGPRALLAWVTSGALALALAFATSRDSPAVGPDVLNAAAWVEAHVDPFGLVCNAPGDTGRWLPALAGRRVRYHGHDGRPPASPAACTILYDDGSLDGRTANEVFRAGGIVLRATPSSP